MPAPIDITSRPQPHQPKSNLTSQLRAAEGTGYAAPEARAGSVSHSNGIPVSNRLRRESMVNSDMARSLMGAGAMSWGAVSVGSWIRDDIIMAGTSPFTFNSPSFHSSSYLPKLEAEFCRDFSCCGLPLPSLHDLLRHYEEFHAQQTGPVRRDESGVSGHELERQHGQIHRPQRRDASGMTSPISGMGGIQLGMMQQQQLQRLKQQQQQSAEGSSQDMREEEEQDGEIAGDMEMDDEEMTPPPNAGPLTPQSHNQYPSHPPTPSTHSHPSYQNTPNLPHAQLSSLNINQQPSHFSPESSGPGTPLAMDQLEYSFSSNMSNMQGVVGAQNNGFNNNNTSFENRADMSLDLCIDEPAKRLFSPGGQAMSGGYTQQQLHMLISGGAQGVHPGAQGSQGSQGPPQEDKPFKCPVIGCEKAYKNQNGLKYHKSHGHTNQQLFANSDGTYSIVNPETSAPYPGTLGMEKEKPYQCELCGKRYKNLNGLKYHRAHSVHPATAPPPGGVIAVAGTGESGIGLV
ncbi:hypothetical protein HOY82DRAFT_537296 [Tuber indicum]|nr:hypothetical protein HOY82DRAFT_537296 [Tuber indicum]